MIIYNSPFASSPLLHNPHHHHSCRRRRRHQNVRRQPIFTMPIRGPILTLRRISTPDYHFRLNHSTQAFCITTQFASLSHQRMAEESENKGKSDPTTSLNGEEKDKAPEKSAPTVPPPPPPLPEKPLPGDCCGSGCVRCVWDVYYDELEEYDRLYKADSKAS